MLQLIFQSTYGRVGSSPNPSVGVLSVTAELLWVYVYIFRYMFLKVTYLLIILSIFWSVTGGETI